MKRRRVIGIILSVLIVAYLLAPIVAGVLRVGERDGPVFYPADFHTLLFRLGYSTRPDGKPRIWSVRVALYDRPLFWGGDFRPKPKAERDSFIAWMSQEHGEEMSLRYREENELIDQGNR